MFLHNASFSSSVTLTMGRLNETQRHCALGMAEGGGVGWGGVGLSFREVVRRVGALHHGIVKSVERNTMIVDKILQPVVFPFFRNQVDVTPFQRNNSRPHLARLPIDFLGQNIVPLLTLPSFSPDLSPIYGTSYGVVYSLADDVSIIVSS